MKIKMDWMDDDGDDDNHNDDDNDDGDDDIAITKRMGARWR